MTSLELKMQEMTEKLNALIGTVDEFTRKPDGACAQVNATSSRVSAYCGAFGFSPGR